MHHPGARVPAGGARILEECEVRPRRAVLVAVEEVVDGRVVLVDRLLDHPQAEHAGVELDVARRVRGDRGDVVNALELHLEMTLSTSATRLADPAFRARPAR